MRNKLPVLVKKVLIVALVLFLIAGVSINLGKAYSNSPLIASLHSGTETHHSLIFAMETLPDTKNEQKLTDELSRWHQEMPFDSYGLKIIPSSDNAENAALIERVNKIGEAVNQDIIPSTQFIGLIRGYHISREEWWENIYDLQCTNIGLVFSLNKETTPEKAEEYLNSFLKAMHQHNKKVFLWCSANMLFRPYLQRFRDWFEKYDKTEIDYFVWMDMPGVEVKEKIPAVEQAEYILSLCPKEKTFFQWVNTRLLPTESPEGTLAYAKKLMTAGAENFCVLGNSRLLSKETWYEFYKNLRENLFE